MQRRLGSNNTRVPLSHQNCALFLDPFADGQIAEYNVFASGVAATTADGLYLVRVGTALTTDRLAVELKRPIFY